jgi:hypothetical protein
MPDLSYELQYAVREVATGELRLAPDVINRLRTIDLKGEIPLLEWTQLELLQSLRKSDQSAARMNYQRCLELGASGEDLRALLLTIPEARHAQCRGFIDKLAAMSASDHSRGPTATFASTKGTAEQGGSNRSPSDAASIASLILGIVCMLVWCLPLLGLVLGVPVAITGIALGIWGLLKSGGALPITGLILSLIGLLLVLLNSLLSFLYFFV